MRSKKSYIAAVLLFVSIITSHVLLLCDGAGVKTKKIRYEKYKDICRGLPVIKKKHEKHLKWLFKTIGKTKIVTGSTPQNEAACWMFRQNTSYSLQRFLLGVVYYSTKGAQWEKNTNWMTMKHECSWYGVNCNMMRTIVELDLAYIEMEGLIPRELGLLTAITDIDLHGNDLQGIIPHKLMDGMRKAQYLRLQMNGLFGSLHKEITHMGKLKELYLFGNFFAGTIPKELSKLKKLEIIDLYANQLTGTIPSELATIPKLKYLDLHDNNLVGTMPQEICDKKLDALIADCHGRNPEVKCDCCTVCCAGLPLLACFDPKTGKQMTVSV